MIYDKESLRQKKFLITGASSGLGRATATMLASCGAELVLCGRNSVSLEETKRSLSESGNHSIEAFDLSTIEQTALNFERIAKRYGALNGVFHAAGISLIKPIKLLSDRDIQSVLGPSLYAALAIGKVFSKGKYLSDGASIVFMSSVSAHAGQQGMTLYSASKAAIEGMSRSLANELFGRSIRVNCVAAGGVETEMHEALVERSTVDAIKAYKHMHLLGFGKPQDIASLVVYLLSDASLWMTGTTVVIDGGYISK